jgi:hypothetical protein
VNPRRHLRRETLYRVIYESFTPQMMHRTPMWLKRRIATTLGWRLVETLSADAWLRKLFIKAASDPSPIGRSMFESCAGGNSMRPFFSRRWLWNTAKRIWTGKRTPPKQPTSELWGQVSSQPTLPQEADCMDRRRLL